MSHNTNKIYSPFQYYLNFSIYFILVHKKYRIQTVLFGNVMSIIGITKLSTFSIICPLTD